MVHTSGEHNSKEVQVVDLHSAQACGLSFHTGTLDELPHECGPLGQKDQAKQSFSLCKSLSLLLKKQLKTRVWKMVISNG